MLALRASTLIVARVARDENTFSSSMSLRVDILLGCAVGLEGQCDNVDEGSFEARRHVVQRGMASLKHSARVTLSATYVS